MAVQKNFTIRNGIEVNNNLFVADSALNRVGVATSTPNYTFEVIGGIGATDINILGISTVLTQFNVGTGGTVITSLNTGLTGFGTVIPEYIVDIRSPVSTGQTSIYVQGDVRITGDLYADDINLDQASFTDLEVTGISTFIGITTSQSTIFANDLDVAGFSAFRGTTSVLTDDLAVFTVGHNIDGTGQDHFGIYYDNVGGFPGIGGTATLFTSNGDININVNDGISRIIFGDGGITDDHVVIDVSSRTFIIDGNLNVTGGNVISGISTINNAAIDTATINNASIYTGIVTTLSGSNLSYSGIGSFGSINAQTARINTGIVTTLSGSNLSYSGIGTINTATIDTALINTGIVTTLSGSNLSYSGISTLGNVRISSGIITSTSGIVTYYGDGKNLIGLTGILPGIYGNEYKAISIEVDSKGRISSITEIPVEIGITIKDEGTTVGSASSVTSINFVGNNINAVASGSISTITVSDQLYVENAGVATSVIGGISSVTSLNVSSSANILGLNYPSQDGLPYQVLMTDGAGNLGFATSNILYENRIYVSQRTGNDSNDGKNAPLRTIEKAAQLASLENELTSIFVEAGEYVENNPIILYDNVSIVGDSLRSVVIRPASAGKDMFRVRNGCYLTGFTLKDYVSLGIPQYTFNYAISFDDPSDLETSRVGYAVTTAKPLITKSPYIQNCSVISFLGANGVLVDGNKVITPNVPQIANEAENPQIGSVPEQGKSIVANAFTLVSFGGIGYRVINDGYAQLVSCFQIFCQDGSLSESGGYLSITNSATNFGTNALRSKGFSSNSFTFNRGIIAANSAVDGKQSLKIIGLGANDQTNYVLRFYDKNLVDKTGQFKSLGISTATFDGITGINTTTGNITSISHNFASSDSVIYTPSTSGSIGGLYDKGEYYVGVVGIDTFRLYEDISLTKPVNFSSTSAGIHTLNKTNNDFFIENITSSHDNYQELTLDSSSYTFVPGRLVTQSSTSATGYAVTFTSNKLVVSKQSTIDFNVGTILDHSLSPQTATINSFVGISTYYTIDVIVGNTETGQNIQNISDLKENYYCHLHRPSIVNSSSHTWEYSGSGNDYNALPQNGGKSNPIYEQVSERSGRVYTSGTNELGDFKVGDAIVAYNRTGDITFNNTVTIGELTSLKFSVGNGPEITEISTDVNLGDSELGGPQDYRITTQKAQRSFLNNRLGNFIDKETSTSSVPNAVVILNSSGQINSDLISGSRESNYYTTFAENARLSLVDDVPANNLLSGDLVVENSGISTITYRLINDKDSQYLILSDNTRNYDFSNGTIITSTNIGSIGIVTTPPNVGYGTTGIVKGVLVSATLGSIGSGYSVGTYTNVNVESSTGVGSSVRADVTVNGAGQISNVDFKFGGKGYVSGDTLRITSIPISGSDYATLTVDSVETRLYTKISNNIKFFASLTSPDFIQDNSAIGLSTDLTSSYSVTFDAATDIDTSLNRIIIGANEYANGDPVVYNIGSGSLIGGLTNDQTYYVKKVGISSVELYTNYGLTNILDIISTGSGTQSLTRVGVNTASNFITLANHGYSVGNAVKVVGVTLPSGLTSNNFYFVGSVTTNSFTLHSLRVDALSSINGLSVNPISLASTGSGIATFTKQNVEYIATVNTSSINSNNYSILSSSDIDASNIISGTISPSRLGSGSASEDTFLSGNQLYQKVVKGVGIGTSEPITAAGSAGFNSSSGITTYYGNINLSLNRVSSILGDLDYTNLGVAKFKKSTFAFDGDGAVRIKTSSQGGDIDADKLDGQDGSYYQDPTNLTTAVPIDKGGTSLTSIPVAGSILVGNGVAYDLTTNPTISGNITAVSIDIACCNCTSSKYFSLYVLVYQ